ncbi:DNA alkylation repair protein [Chloroflexi bacterium TSY]|nr:DNA alkylation repair protein [Chloroflexi bacterium TSY]
MMNETDVLKYLESNKNERGIHLWQSRQNGDSLLITFGVGITTLRKLAKHIGRDHNLSAALWQSDVYDARILALLIDDPKAISIEQAESQIDQINDGQIAHVFSSCDATLAKAPFVVELTIDWIRHKDPMRRRCGYGLLYEIAKSKRKSAPNDDFFEEQILHIESSYPTEIPFVNHALGVALMGIGMRNQLLHAKALKLAREIGDLQIETDSHQLKSFSVEEKLTNDFVLQKLGLA